MATARTRTPPLALDDLPHDALARVATFLTAPDLAAANATARLFRSAPPDGRTAIEHALRAHSLARGHEHALPATLPSDVRSWTEELFLRERLLELARAHSPPVAAGGDFSAFVDAEGGLHTCGDKRVRMQGEGERRWFEYRGLPATGHSGAHACVPTHVASLSAVRVCSLAAGWGHLLAMSEAGAVYACGKNEHGQLGLGDDEARLDFEPIAALADVVVVGIAAGREHSLALTAAGCAYSWGHNRCGQLGHGDEEDRWEPTRIEALDGVRVGGGAGGALHTLLLSAQGDVYSCGCGDYGRLGHGDQETPQRTPTRVEALAGVRAVHVSAGSMHSLVVDADGLVCSFGRNGRGQLGNGARRSLATPRRIEALADVRAVRACTGSNTSAVVGADGNVHTFGNNSNGQLGHDGAGEGSLPTRVGGLAHTRVLRCAMGYSHSLFVGADGNVYSCGKRSAALGLGMRAHEGGTAQIDIPACVETECRARVC